MTAYFYSFQEQLLQGEPSLLGIQRSRDLTGELRPLQSRQAVIAARRQIGAGLNRSSTEAFCKGLFHTQSHSIRQHSEEIVRIPADQFTCFLRRHPLQITPQAKHLRHSLPAHRRSQAAVGRAKTAQQLQSNNRQSNTHNTGAKANQNP